MKILIVEDDLEISKLLADFLQGNGYEVLCQYDGLHVLDCIQEHQIDLILLDIMLPYRSGDTILADIRKFSTVPVIVISAKETTQNKIDLLRLGADDYIFVPCDSAIIKKRVHNLVEKYILENFRNSISAADLSREFGFDASYLSRQFKEQVGMTPWRFILNLKLEEAQRLLLSHPDMLIKDIALEIGYNDPLYFSRIFKKYIGVYPSEYRDSGTA